MSKDANIFRQSLCTNCTSTGMCISIWIWICSQRPAANLLLSESANIGAHSDFSNDPKAKWSCNTAKNAKTANMDLLVQHDTSCQVLPRKLQLPQQQNQLLRLQGKVIHCPPVGFPNPLEDQSLNWNPATGWSSSARFHWAYSILRYSK